MFSTISKGALHIFFFCNVKAMNLNFSHGKTSPPNYSFKTETDSPNLLGKKYAIISSNNFFRIMGGCPKLKKSA